MNSVNFRTKIEQLKGKKYQLENDIEILELDVTKQKRDLVRHEKALEVVKQIGLKTQQQLTFHISNITSLALEAVFQDPYELKVDFVEKRNKTECEIYFERGGNKIDPMGASGVGVIDVAAFALRIASWTIQIPKTTPTIILDEPFKHLRGQIENEKVLSMLKEISDKLNIQIIMVGDEKVSEDVLEKYADKLIRTKIKNRITYVT